jgi:hypothetical protein
VQFHSRQLTVEILEQVPTDANREVELLDEGIVELADPALSVQQLLPGVVSVGSQRSRHRDAGDNHIRETVSGRELRHGVASFPPLRLQSPLPPV